MNLKPVLLPLSTVPSAAHAYKILLYSSASPGAYPTSFSLAGYNLVH